MAKEEKEEKPREELEKPIRFEELIDIRLPDVEEKEVVLVRLPDGRVVARTREELEKMKKEE